MTAGLSLGTVVVWCVQTFAHVTVDAPTALAFGTVLAFFLGWLVPESS